MFCKKCVLRNFAKFTGKYLRQSLFFNRVAGLRPATLLKKGLWRKCFPVNFAKFLRTPFIEHLRTTASDFTKNELLYRHLLGHFSNLKKTFVGSYFCFNVNISKIFFIKLMLRQCSSLFLCF